MEDTTELKEPTARAEQNAPPQQTEQTEHSQHTAQAQQARQEEQRTEMETVITFDGLLVFRPDQADKICEVGVLHTRDHSQPHLLQIEITPNPDTGSGKLTLDHELLESYVRGGNISWKLEVVKSGQEQTGIVLNPGIPADRRDGMGANNKDFGWIVNIESGEFHSRPLVRTRGKLKPIILLKKGELFTKCLTDGVDIKQGPNTRFNFGFIAGAIGLKLTGSDGDLAVLYFQDQQGRPTTIFRLPRLNEIPYEVSIQNTPLDAPQGGHFHLFYDRLFQGLGDNQKFDILPSYPPIVLPRPPRCHVNAGPDPNPFRCGGVSVGSSGGPLS